MHPRITAMIRYLLNADTAVKSEFLAGELEITSRTLRSDMKILNELLEQHGASVLATRGKGYELKVTEPALFREWVDMVLEEGKDEKESVLIFPEERIDFIVRTLLLADRYTKVEELADQLYVSSSTVQKNLKAVREKLAKYGINIEKKPYYGLKITGDEFGIRLCMSEFLSKSLLSLEDNIFGIYAEELTQIREITIAVVRRQKLYFSDSGLENLLKQVVITLKRIVERHVITFLPEGFNTAVHPQEYVAAMDLVLHLERVFHIHFHELEIAYLTMHLLGTERLFEFNHFQEQADSLLNKECYHYARLMVDEIAVKLKLDIEDDEVLISGLSLHLQPVLNRVRYGMNQKNPMLETIKTAYPLAFQAAIIGTDLLRKQFNLILSENEIGYIALHIGAAVERIKDRISPKRCIIVCGTGLGSAGIIHQKVRKHFYSRLEVVGTFGYYNLEKAPLQQIDFVLTTVPIEQHLPVPTLLVQTLLSDEDLHTIENMLNGFEKEWYRFVREDLVFLQQDLSSRDEVLEFLSRQLQEKQLVDDHFLESVQKREEVASTAYGNLTAIPHPISPQTHDTFWVICSLKKQILWGDKYVQFICLLCIAKGGVEDLTHMYDMLIKVTSQPELVEQLIKTKTYHEIMAVLTRF